MYCSVLDSIAANLCRAMSVFLAKMDSNRIYDQFESRLRRANCTCDLINVFLFFFFSFLFSLVIAIIVLIRY